MSEYDQKEPEEQEKRDWMPWYILGGGGLAFCLSVIGYLKCSRPPERPSQSALNVVAAAEKLDKAWSTVQMTWARRFVDLTGHQYEQPGNMSFYKKGYPNPGKGTLLNGCGFYLRDSSTIAYNQSLLESPPPGADADLAATILFAHEFGHHIQHVLGKDTELDGLLATASEADKAKLRLKYEHQADYYAGVWASVDLKFEFKRTNIEKAIKMLADFDVSIRPTLPKDGSIPDPMDYASAKERVDWMEKGFDSGSIRAGDSILTSK
ncbi:MAG: hypothetical protein GC165_14560 [Armatimonadetes bacterium]|nr:hypothetical protein [Armatimonadota bacterium]